MDLSGGTAFERHASIRGDKDRPALFPQIIQSRNNWLIFWYADTSQVLPRHQQCVCCLNTSLPFWDKEIPFSQERRNLALYRYLIVPSGMENIWYTSSSCTERSLLSSCTDKKFYTYPQGLQCGNTEDQGSCHLVIVNYQCYNHKVNVKMEKAALLWTLLYLSCLYLF